MKLALMLLLVNSAYAASVINAPVKHLYVPEGFDSNDSVEVVVTGTFPNPCYSRNKVDVHVEDDVIDIAVTGIAPDHKLIGSRACPDMAVPFKEVVTVGNLQGGEYKINVNDGALKDKVMVKEATSSAVDDHIYAAIEWIEKKSADQVVLHGWRYSPCLELDRIEVMSNGKDTFSMLPIMKQVSDFCPMKGMPVSFNAKVNLRSLKMNQPLLYVRTMDGKSVNSILNLEERR